jgi:HAT1-interacting factor 1
MVSIDPSSFLIKLMKVDEGGPSTLIESADPEIIAEAEAAAAAEQQGEDVPPEEQAQSGEAGIDEEPEDDYNAAWEVLDVARTIYLEVIEAGEGKGKGKADGGEEGKQDKLCLADCYQTLGDISCETGKLPSWTSTRLSKESIS